MNKTCQNDPNDFNIMNLASHQLWLSFYDIKASTCHFEALNRQFCRWFYLKFYNRGPEIQMDIHTLQNFDMQKVLTPLQ